MKHHEVILRTLFIFIAVVTFLCVYTAIVAQNSTFHRALYHTQSTARIIPKNTQAYLNDFGEVKERGFIRFNSKQVLTTNTQHLNNGIKREKLDRSVRNKILKIHTLLYDVWRYTRGTKSLLELKKAISLTEDLLGHVVKNKYFSQLNGKSNYVCPEEFKGTTFGYPYFYRGFEKTNCSFTKTKPIVSYLSIVLDLSSCSNNNVQTMLKALRTTYPLIHLLVLMKPQQLKLCRKYNIQHTLFVTGATTHGKLWNDLVARAETEFVLIARDVTYFNAFDARLERLVRVIDELNIVTAGGARRGLHDGIWHNGCYQSATKNYTLSYTEGYDKSSLECLFCDYSSGPFVIRKTNFIKLNFSSNYYGDILYRDFFLRLQSSNHQSVVCPDSMFYTISNRYINNHNREAWKPFMQKHGLYKLRLNYDISHSYSCDEIQSSFEEDSGAGLSPCSLENLAYAVKKFMQICVSLNIICELQEGTLLGAVKLGKVLPWERDADLTFLTSNFSALAKQNDLFVRAGLNVYFNKEALWCCADGILAGGKGGITYKGWSIELYGQHRMDTELLGIKNISPTKLLFDGQLVNVPRNPGLHVRNRYGHMIYGHSSHWLTIAGESGWINYVPKDFSKCPHKFENCLDLFFPDGNIQFQQVLP